MLPFCFLQTIFAELWNHFHLEMGPIFDLFYLGLKSGSHFKQLSEAFKMTIKPLRLLSVTFQFMPIVVVNFSNTPIPTITTEYIHMTGRYGNFCKQKL